MVLDCRLQNPRTRSVTTSVETAHILYWHCRDFHRSRLHTRPIYFSLACYASLIYAVYGASWIAVKGAKRTPPASQYLSLVRFTFDS